MSILEQAAHIRGNGIRQHFLHFPGDGPSVVIVPGIVSPAILWRHVGVWLADRYDCYILDVRGRGLSESGSHLDYGLAECAADLLAFVTALELRKPIVVGHSMGGRIALRASTLEPERFGAVVAVDPPTSGPGRRPYPIPKTRTVDLLRAAYRGKAMEAMRQNGSVAWPDTLQALRAEWLPTCDERAVHVTYDDFHNEDVFADIAQVVPPVSLLCAGLGGVVSDNDLTELRALRPDLFITRLAEAGHQMQAENFEAFKPALAEHIARHAASLMERQK